MRRLSVLFALLFVLVACDDGDGADPEPTEPPATPTEEVSEETDSTPEDTEPTPEPDTEDGATPEPVASPTEPAEGEDENGDEEPADLDERIDEIAEQVVELRGLELEEELDFSVINRDELKDMLEDEVDLEDRDTDLYWIFRLIDDREVDLEQLLIDAQAVDIYGFYDPETQQTYVISEDDAIGVLEEVFVAHELVHALQDQHYDLGQLESLEPDFDSLMAFRAMVEGDATLSQQLYAQEYLTEEELAEFQQEAMAATQDEEAVEILDELPRYFLEGLSLPYTAGLRFMMQTYDGDFEGVNAALENPPESVQQVLNPGDYLAGEIEDPVEIDLADPTGDLDGDWEEHRSGTFGVFDLRIILQENGVEETEDVLDSWRGSAFSSYVTDQDVLGIIESRWESEEDAAAFEEALVQTMADYDEENGVWSGEEQYHTISSDGNAVILYSSSNQDALVDAAEIE